MFSSDVCINGLAAGSNLTLCSLNSFVFKVKKRSSLMSLTCRLFTDFPLFPDQHLLTEVTVFTVTGLSGQLTAAYEPHVMEHKFNSFIALIQIYFR